VNVGTLILRWTSRGTTDWPLACPTNNSILQSAVLYFYFYFYFAYCLDMYTSRFRNRAPKNQHTQLRLVLYDVRTGTVVVIIHNSSPLYSRYTKPPFNVFTLKMHGALTARNRAFKNTLSRTGRSSIFVRRRLFE
jgi:hypothetical protein